MEDFSTDPNLPLNFDSLDGVEVLSLNGIEWDIVRIVGDNVS